jgi:pimeloyl-ACP methyl ester carboxylesterase
VIFIPGLAAHRDVWNATTQALGGRYRMHLVQVNGFAGFTSQGNAEGPVTAPVAEEIARYIREKGLSKPALVGHSMGGTIAMMVAARHPELVGHLMVVDMTPNIGQIFAGPTATSQSIAAMADKMSAQIAAGTPGSPTDLLGQMIYGMTRSDAMRSVLLKYARDTDRRTAANALHELTVLDMRSELARITAPTTVLYVIPPGIPMKPEEFETAEREQFVKLAGARLIKVEGSNHYIQIDQPSVVATELDALMRR